MTPGLAALLSLACPGLGQLALGRRERGAALVAAALAAVGLAVWLNWRPLWLLLAPYWLAAAWDARSAAAGARRPAVWLIAAAALPIYVAGARVTEIDPGRLVSGAYLVRPLLAEFLSPDLVEHERERIGDTVLIHTPCPERPAAAAPPTDDGPRVRVEPMCAGFGQQLKVMGEGYPPNEEVILTWVNPGRARAPLGAARSDAHGGFTAAIEVPRSSVPEAYQSRVQTQRLEAYVLGPKGGYVPSRTARLVAGQIGVTIGLALMATLAGAILAIPLGLLGARNLMGGHHSTLVVYGLVRGLMNFVRSIEPLILAVLFATWVSMGPFAGMLALAFHGFAALGKLYSEQIEAIDPGPVEAMRATGANWLQTVVFAVLPQVVTQFTAFTVYRWDINVRMSTILGYVGGGGIGFLLRQWIFLRRWSEAATAVLAIAVVVMALDLLSGSIRERIAAGRALVARRMRPLAYAGLAVLVAWSWRVSEVRPLVLVQDAHKIRKVASGLVSPELIAREVVTETARTVLAVPCAASGGHGDSGRGPTGRTAPAPAPEPMSGAYPTTARASRPEPGSTGAGGPTIRLMATCANEGEYVRVQGAGFRPGGQARLYWLPPTGGRLFARRAEVSPAGRFAADLEVRPLLAVSAAETGEPVVLSAVLTYETGRAWPSRQAVVTFDSLIVTVLMALIATTAGALLALPVSFLAARNLMPPNPVGHLAYYSTRAFLNALRSVEPIILASIFAMWVGQGSPFAGILALTLVTLANLGKLLSEALESIEVGPIEAIRATGATGPQVIAYGVIPQMVPPFLSFGMYQWDINVRMSTVIGAVGGGGIGFVLFEWMNRVKWTWASVAIIGIVVVVSSMDYFSARVRARLT